MKLEIKDVQGKSGTILTIGGEVGFSEVSDLKCSLEEALNADSGAVLLDLSELSFVASDGLGVFIRARANAEERGKEFFLLSPQPRIFDLLHKTQLDKIFTICHTMDEALAKL